MMKAPLAGTPLIRLEIGRRFGLVTLVIAMVAVGFAGWTRVAAEDQPASRHAAALGQLSPGSVPSLTVTGYGEASAPADSARLQLLIGPAQVDVGMSMSGSSGGEVWAVTTGEVSDGTPGPGTTTTTMMPAGPSPAPTVDDAALEPVLSALEDGGISRDAVEIAISPLIADPYAGPYSGAARLEFTVEQPEQDALNSLLATVSQRASEAGLSLIQVGAAYQVADCQSLEDEAQIAAIEDARQRAERLADQLGVTTGETLLASDFGLFGGPGDGGGCSPYDGAGSYTSYGGPGGIHLTLPDFDPARPAEVVITKQLYLGLAIT